jgi:hypothetical protein
LAADLLNNLVLRLLKEDKPMSKSEKTSGRVASKASGILRSPNASKAAKSIAGSALAQAGTGKTTSAKVASTAAKALDSGRTGEVTKTVAGSVLTQKAKRT